MNISSIGNKSVALLFLMSIVLLDYGCVTETTTYSKARKVESSEEVLPDPTPIAEPIATLEPTAAAVASATATPEPTATPTPMATPEPTATPTPTPINAITVSTIEVSNIGQSSFDVVISFSGDENENASVYVNYCSETASAGCNPLLGNSASMAAGSGAYSAFVEGLVSGQVYNVEISATDVDGVIIGFATTSVDLIDPPVCEEGYIEVVADAAVDQTDNFCVAKYEMKNVGSVAIAEAAGLPWVNVSKTMAVSYCSALGANYHLITNNEWMAIARSIEGVANNWSSGNINRGHSDNSPAALLAADEDGQGCANTEQLCTTNWDEQKRTHLLSNGEVIWDLAGNAREWVNWAPTRVNSGAVWLELNAQTPSTAMPAKTFMSEDVGLTMADGIGAYIPGTTTGISAIRGGHFSLLNETGIYTLDLSLSAAAWASNLGFRCSYNPTVVGLPVSRFSIVPISASIYSGGNVTATVKAVDRFGATVTSYQGDVTLVISGPATGGGLVNIVNGEGSLTLIGTAAGQVILSLDDTEGSGLDVASTSEFTVKAVCTAGSAVGVECSGGYKYAAGKVVAMVNQSTGSNYGGTGILAGATNANDGSLNVAALNGDGQTHPAHSVCQNLVLDGFSDWYLPAVNELLAIKAVSSIASTFTLSQYYMSSTEIDASNAKLVSVNNLFASDAAIAKGGATYNPMTSRYVRCVRKY